MNTPIFTAELDEDVYPHFPNEVDGPIYCQTVTIFKDGEEFDAVRVEASEDQAPYDAAVSKAIGGAEFTWIN